MLALAETGHITCAATQLGLQQPPLSQQIKALRNALGLQRFRRQPKGVTLTDAGRLLQAEARHLLHEPPALELRLPRVARGEEGRLALGLTSLAAAQASCHPRCGPAGSSTRTSRWRWLEHAQPRALLQQAPIRLD